MTIGTLCRCIAFAGALVVATLMISISAACALSALSGPIALSEDLASFLGAAAFAGVSALAGGMAAIESRAIGSRPSSDDGIVRDYPSTSDRRLSRALKRAS